MNASPFASAQSRMASVVLPGETVVWTGAAPAGIRFRAIDALLVPFSLMWGGFAFFWEFSVISTPYSPFFFKLWGIPFVLAGVYIILGRFVIDAYLRSKTMYAVTDRAAYIARFDLYPSIRRYEGSALDAIAFEPAASGKGTIRFSSQTSLLFNRWLWSSANLDTFLDIPDARRVYGLVSAAR